MHGHKRKDSRIDAKQSAFDTHSAGDDGLGFDSRTFVFGCPGFEHSPTLPGEDPALTLAGKHKDGLASFEISSKSIGLVSSLQVLDVLVGQFSAQLINHFSPSVYAKK